MVNTAELLRTPCGRRSTYGCPRTARAPASASNAKSKTAGSCCDRLSWKVAEVCRDNDVSAYSGKTRPDWERLLADVRAGDIDAIVCTSRSMSDTTASLHAQRVLFQSAETRAFAKILDTRSVGVRDLRYGSIVDEDWCDVDPDEFMQDRCREVPFLAGTAYYFIAVTVTK